MKLEQSVNQANIPLLHILDSVGVVARMNQ